MNHKTCIQFSFINFTTNWISHLYTEVTITYSRFASRWIGDRDRERKADGNRISEIPYGKMRKAYNSLNYVGVVFEAQPISGLNMAFFSESDCCYVDISYRHKRSPLPVVAECHHDNYGHSPLERSADI